MERLLSIFEDFPIIELEEYNLRKIKMLDFKEIYNIYSDEETVNFEGIKVIKTEAQAKEYIQNILKGYEKKYFIRWCIARKDSDEVIGLVALHHIDYRNYSAQIGYILNKRYWRKNIMSQVLNAVIKFIFNETEIHRLEAIIHPDNKASLMLAEKLGFIKEGFKRDSAYNKETQKFEDIVIMGLINNKYSG